MLLATYVAVRPKGGVRMRNYEIMFIVKADLAEEDVNKEVNTLEKIITDMNGKITSSKDLGQKKLAYEIDKQVRGYYHLLNVECDTKAVKEFDRRASLDEKVLRHLIIKEEE